MRGITRPIIKTINRIWMKNCIELVSKNAFNTSPMDTKNKVSKNIP